MLQPILLRPHGDGFEIIAGERRWRAAQRARLHTIPAIVRDIDDSATAEIALIENIQREDLNAIEEAEGYRQLIDQHGHSQDDISRLVHKSRSHVANLLRLLDVPQFVRDSLIRGEISMGHARAVANAPDPEGLAKEIIAKGMSVRQTEPWRAPKRSPRPIRRTSRPPPIPTCRVGVISATFFGYAQGRPTCTAGTVTLHSTASISSTGLPRSRRAV